MRRRGHLPDEVRAALELRGRERVLAAAADTGGRWVVGTQHALHLPGRTGYRRVPWELLERGEWDREAEVLRVSEIAGFGDPEPETRIALAGDGGGRERLLALIRERISASVVVATRVRLRDRAGVQVVARRPPGGAARAESTELTWYLVFDDGLDPAASDVLADARRALAEVQAQVSV